MENHEGLLGAQWVGHQPGPPRQVITDGQVWIDLLDHRNLLLHIYDFTVFGRAVQAIDARYLPAVEQLHGFLLRETLK